jgi:type II secretory pathway pseudopilin PulG
MKYNKKASIWVSTILYTLIGLAVIGTLLAVAKPKIDQTKDNLVVEQTIDSLNTLNEKIIEASQAAGTRLGLEFKMAKGTLTVNPDEDSISWEFKGSRYQLSEATEGNDFKELGILKVQTKKLGDKFNILLRLELADKVNLITENDNFLQIQKSNTPYKVWIENIGSNLGEIPKIKIYV